MSINKQSNQHYNLQIGVTSNSMVRIYIESETHQIPMDFDQEQAQEIANELMEAVAQLDSQR